MDVRIFQPVRDLADPAAGEHRVGIDRKAALRRQFIFGIGQLQLNAGFFLVGDFVKKMLDARGDAGGNNFAPTLAISPVGVPTAAKQRVGIARRS
ncbi:MAG: hypothetical protein HY210_05540 [Candidatus Omnitrophica bacterium]|nr:hypothetical protein [Candidatus Omnitrophota bacterium]